MRTKKVNRYWCDFCDKAGLQAGAMRKHEKHCTLNPDRSCRVCGLLSDNQDYEFEPVPLAALIAILPDSSVYHADHVTDKVLVEFNESVVAAIPALRKASGDCPACMLAALRQAKIPVPIAEGFDFTAEMKAIFSEINENRQSEEYYF